MVGFVETQLRSSAAPEDARDSALRLADAGRPETEHGPGQHIDIHSHLHQILNTIAPLQVDVLIQGETGTGKDTLARRLYQLSGCRGPMVPVNCAAIPETLAESELFGVMTGAFTGASASRAGYIETANDGLLFLDEIDSMPLIVQAKLLRVLENRAVERLGSTKSIRLNLRVVAASQAPLEELVAQGRFRRDLFFRLDTIKLSTPALRHHPELIIPMFRRFTQEAAMRLNQALPPRSWPLEEALLLHSWPGNIRELKAVAERFVLGLPPLCNDVKKEEGRCLLKDRLRRIERSLITDCLHRHGNRIDDVIHELGIPRRTLYHRLKLLKLHA
ncbi:sigma 54-interacting transcriptional regulator [Siccibacter turicensis]|uniref:sigma 54-interacting transcriptional regulator n=1 Tax=Siccibacter turicensis TaxID=357233 RepID=UPI0023F4CB56|nr:sigma 54-interacting transcriptional regulator [Siccibacter turicensis]